MRRIADDNFSGLPEITEEKETGASVKELEEYSLELSLTSRTPRGSRYPIRRISETAARQSLFEKNLEQQIPGIRTGREDRKMSQATPTVYGSANKMFKDEDPVDKMHSHADPVSCLAISEKPMRRLL